jgi:predicted O-linked N-acetylglucosamine transferase (SPINDLY family)
LSGDVPSYLPEPFTAQCNLGKTLNQQGRLREAEACFRHAIELQSDSPLPYYFLGNSLYQHRPAEAEACYRRAIELQPDFALAYCNLGSLLGKMRRLPEEQACYRRAIEFSPDLAEAHNNLGRTLTKQGKFIEAEEFHRRALALKPDSAEVHYNLGEDLAGQGRLSEAEQCFRRAIALKPELVAAHCRLGNMLNKQGLLPEAEACYRAAIARDSNCVEAVYALANLLYADGQTLEAAACYERVIRLKPDSAFAYTNLGGALGVLGNPNEEEQCYRRAIELNPGLAAAHVNLGNTLKKQGDVTEARACYQQALEIQPDFAEALCNLGTLNQEHGLLMEAESCYRRALALAPDFAVAHSNLLFCLLHSPEIDAKELFAEHCAFGEHFEKPLRVSWAKHANLPDANRSLRIGFVSGDLRSHPIPFFIESVLSCLTTSPGFLLLAFVNQTLEDQVTERLRMYFHRWHPIANMSDIALSDMIKDEEIDILIDLSGHTANNRLMTFARKPAPIQVGWLGYMGTTGMVGIDYYLGDRFMLPIEQFRTQFTEQLVYLPATGAFLPSEEAPPVNALPALENGYMTFGSFNRASKLNPGSVNLWAQLMRALPGARLVVGNMRAQTDVDLVSHWFHQAGLTRESLTFHPAKDMKSYLELHHSVDLCLDTLPYTGFTTTLHAMWMGVPTLTLTGFTVPGRQSTAMLSHVGLEGFIATDKTDFVERGLALAENTAVLASVRSTLRERMNASPLGQPERVAAGLAEALRSMWIRWCAGLPPRPLVG